MRNLREQLDTYWAYICTMLPVDLDEMARTSGALRRCRNVRNAHTLMRIILTYGATDLSMKAIAGWACVAGLARMSGPALFYRLRDSAGWLSEVLAAVLGEDVQPTQCKGLRIRITDASGVVGPGANGSEWLVHSVVDPVTGHLCSVDVTNDRVGENFSLHPVEPGDVMMGDRAYALATGIAYVHGHGGYVVARTNLHAIRLCRPDGSLFKPLNEVIVPELGVASWDVLIPTPPASRSRSHKPWRLEDASGWIPARLVALRTMKGPIVWIITTLSSSQASDEEVMDLYRLRWQVELEFKRLKSLLGLDSMPSRQGPTARSWLLARLLVAALVEKLLRKAGAFSPWGYRLPSRATSCSNI